MKMNRSMACNDTRDDGFTLTDLLAVIVTVGILGLLLLPALAGTKPNSKALQCLENQRQLVRAWQMYAQDNLGVLPRNGDEGNQPSSLTDTSKPQWCPGRVDSGNPAQALDPRWIQIGQIYPYVKTVNIYRCPADTSTMSPSGMLNGGNGAQPRVRSMSMNCWIGPYLVWAPNYNVFYKENDLGVMGAANVWLFLDENPYSINDGYMIAYPGPLQWIDYPATYHSGASGISFCDGHAQFRRWTDKTVLNMRTANPSSMPPNPLNCPDLPWLQALSTKHL